MCDPFRLFPLARDAVELADGILKHPAFGDNLAQTLSFCSSATIVSSWTRGVQVYHDVVPESSSQHVISPVQMVVLQCALVVSTVLFVLSLFWWFCSEYQYIHHALRTLRFKIFGHSRWTQHEKVKGEEPSDLHEGSALVLQRESTSLITGRIRSPRYSKRDLDGAMGELHLPLEAKHGRTPTKRYTTVILRQSSQNDNSLE